MTERIQTRPRRSFHTRAAWEAREDRRRRFESSLQLFEYALSGYSDPVYGEEYKRQRDALCALFKEMNESLYKAGRGVGPGNE